MDKVIHVPINPPNEPIKKWNLYIQIKTNRIDAIDNQYACHRRNSMCSFIVIITNGSTVLRADNNKNYSIVDLLSVSGTNKV